MNARRLRRWTAAALIACPLAAVPSAHASGPPKGFLVMSGSRSAYQDITLGRSTTFDAIGDAVRYDGRSSLLGFYLEPLAGDPAAGVGFVRSTAFGSSGFAARSLPLGRKQYDLPLGSAITLKAGRYRVHLFAAGSATITVPVTGLAGKRRVTPTHTTAISVGVTDVTPPQMNGAAAPGRAAFSLPIAVGPRTIAIAALRVVRRGSTPGSQAYYTGCIESDTVPVCRSAGDGTYFDSTSHNDSASMTFTEAAYSATYYFPGSLPTGRAAAQGSITTPSQLQSVVGFSFALPL